MQCMFALKTQKVCVKRNKIKVEVMDLVDLFTINHRYKIEVELEFSQHILEHHSSLRVDDQVVFLRDLFLPYALDKGLDHLEMLKIRRNDKDHVAVAAICIPVNTVRVQSQKTNTSLLKPLLLDHQFHQRTNLQGKHQVFRCLLSLCDFI